MKNGSKVHHIQQQRQREPRQMPPVGHERPLAAMISSGQNIIIQLIGGEEIVGKITHFDKWSITYIAEGSSVPSVMFKHAMEGFTSQVQS